MGAMADAVLHAIAFDREGRGHRIADPSAAPADAAYIWTHLDANEDGAKPCLVEQLKLDDWTADSILAEDTRPRCEMFGDAAQVNLRGINHNPGDEPEDMVSVRMWVSPKRIVTARFKPVLAIEDVAQAITEGRARAPTPGALVGLIAMRLADRMTPTITELNDQIDEFEEQVTDNVESISRAKLAQLRRQAIMIRRYVAPQREALNRLALEVVPWSTDQDRRRFREAADTTTRIAEEIDAARERAAIVQEQIYDARAVALNRSTLVLSATAVVFLPLNLIAGLFGMNVAGVPLAESVLGFWIISVVLILLGALGVYLFRRIGWL